MPFKLSTASMVTSPTGRGVVVIGGWNDKSSKYSTSLFELDGNSMEWIKLKQTLEYGRVGHVSFPIPDDLTYIKKCEHSKPAWKKLKKKIPQIFDSIF